MPAPLRIELNPQEEETLAQLRQSDSPTFLTPKAIGKAKKLTASRFEPGVRSWVQMTLCYESSCLHQNQLDWAQKAIYLA